MRLRVWLVLFGLWLPSPGGVGAADPTYGFEIVDEATPAELAAGSEIRVPVVVRNDGSVVWEPGQGFAVAYHWLRADGEVEEWDGLRTQLKVPVAPGSAARLDARLAVPATPGHYLLTWDVVEEGVCWLSERDPTPTRPVSVLVRVSHAFTLLAQDRPAWMWAGGRDRCRLSLRNDGQVMWRADGSFNLSYHWSTREGEVEIWDGLRTALPAEVPPGERVTVDAVVEAPPGGGRFLLRWDMVEEGVCWFEQRDPSSKPAPSVWVLPAPGVGPRTLTLATLVATIGVVAAARGRCSARAVGALAVADVAWVGASCWVKQWTVLAEAGQAPTSAARWTAAGGVALVLLVLVALPRRVRPWCSWAVAVMCAVVVCADTVYLRYFGDIVSVAVLRSAGQAAQVSASVSALLRAADVWMVIDLVLGVVLVGAVARLQGRVNRRPAVGMALVLMIPLVVGTGVGVRALGSSASVLHQVFRNVFVAREIGVLNFHAFDLTRALGRRLLQPHLEQEDVERVAAWFRGQAASRAGTGPWFGVASGRNLLMVQVESLQGFVISYRVNGTEVTPNLNRWRADSLSFRQVSDQTDHGRSSDCELATQVGLLPHPGGPAAFLYATNDFTGLAEVLADHGYRSLSAVPFDGSFWNRRLSHPAYGYASSLFDAAFAPGEKIGWGLSDADFMRQMVPRLARLQRPFAAYLITLSLHHPFVGFPDHHKVLDVGQWEDTPFGNYLHTMHFFDRAFGELVADLERQGLLDETVVAVWGDHDAGLGWDQEMAAAIGTRWHEPDWYLTERVPLLIRVPGVPGLRGQSPVPAGQADVAPTLLALLGIDPAGFAFVGRNLLGEPGAGPVPGAYRSWLDDRRLFVPGGPTLEEGRCYDLDSLELIDVEACRAGFESVSRRLEVSRLVLEHDLQGRLRDMLRDPPGEP